MLANILQKTADGKEKIVLEKVVLTVSMTKEQTLDDTKQFSYKDFYNILKNAEQPSVNTTESANIVRG